VKLRVRLGAPSYRPQRAAPEQEQRRRNAEGQAEQHQRAVDEGATADAGQHADEAGACGRVAAQ
jgi:hypothetical protein